MTVKQKLIFAILLFSAWGACVAYDPSLLVDFVAAIKMALYSLGVFTVAMVNPKEQ